MAPTLYFSGRADDAQAAKTFLELVQESAARQKLQAKRSGTELIIELNSDADDVVIQINERNLFEGTMKPSAQEPEADLRAIAMVFAETHRHLNAFLLVDGESKTLFEHGNVIAMEALLDEALTKKTAADMVLEEDAMGPLDTKWFSNCRVLGQDGGLLLKVSLDAKSRIGTPAWKALVASVGKLNGVATCKASKKDAAFDLTMKSTPTPEDSKRIAIAASFMVDDAITETRDADAAIRKAAAKN